MWVEKSTHAWAEICSEARSGLIVIKAFRAAKEVSKSRGWYEAEHATLREPIPADFFQENVAFGQSRPYPLYYADKDHGGMAFGPHRPYLTNHADKVSGSIFDAPWLDPVVLVLELATSPAKPPLKQGGPKARAVMAAIEKLGFEQLNSMLQKERDCQIQKEVERSAGLDVCERHIHTYWKQEKALLGSS